VSTDYVVRQGDCIASIGADYGFLPKTIWNHPANAELKQRREFENVLLPGDIVVIPDKVLRHENRPTDNRHVFVRKGVPEKLEVVLLDDAGLPRANLFYVVTIDGRSVPGNTDAEGRLRISIPPNARQGHLLVRDGQLEEEYPLQLGHLDPITEITGVQARLSNLGFDCGSERGESGPKTMQAIRQFQESAGLEPTGELDNITREKLKIAHGS
jgi:hypothetical protein